ncbi:MULTISPECIES: DUF4177 domain-containing protein [unclassified Fusibacter]|uniref:DUF4177 domain-containing protein n=1 Tax=unclassified Fusibacter TaxID=2624464 RepID=UPI0010115C57|nr:MULTISPECIES: DUF4177 domain-containing protein [unclassified Fusibacter]MCK8060645.1 DUF4177 domain-containing protein [Fusibacter sp. A2]NPE22901.1 DUF4177 domain-containing protein [Fusibacter sp. A1]RXV59969.1 DUF4177 domain-containing protein [Fusibacter sp. A1]
MYQYKYVKTTLGSFFEDANHHEIINSHAKEGWRFVQVLANHYNGHGKPAEFEIIFEKTVLNDDKA